MYDGPILDNHFHLDPRGLVEEAARQFQRAGGTHLVVVHKPYGEPPRLNRTIDDHRRDFDTTLALAERVRRAVHEVRVFVALGPHPAEFTAMLEQGHGLEGADRVYRAAVELAGRYVSEGKAVALGEIGRPHWQPVE
ncbi:MAG: TatD family hydrolase, partial [bacterium]